MDSMSKRTQYILIAIMYTASTAMAIYFLIQNKLPLSWDQSGYMEVSAQLGHALRHFDLLSAAKTFIWHHQWANRPAMFMLSGGIFAALTNFDINLIVLLSNMFWVGLILVVTYKLSEYLQANSGLLSVFFLVSSYSIIFLYRDYFSELALTCGLLLVQYSYIKSEKLHNRRWSLYTLFFMITGALIKETFILYVFPLFIYSTSQFFYTSGYQDRIYWKNWALVFVVSALIVLLFYLPIMAPLLLNMADNVGSNVGRFYARPYAKNTINYYLVYLYYVSYITSILYFLIPCIAFILDYASKKHHKQEISFNMNNHGLIVALLLIGPVLVLTLFVTDANFRFIIPILPLFLILCSVIVQKLTYKLKTVVFYLLITLGLLNLITSITPVKSIPQLVTVGPWMIFGQHYYSKSIGIHRLGFQGIDKDYTKVINEVFSALYSRDIKTARIGVLVAKALINVNVFRSYSAINNDQLIFKGFEQVSTLANTDYVITTDGDLSHDPKVNKKIVRDTNNYIMAGVKQGKFSLVQALTNPNGSHLYIIDVRSKLNQPIIKTN